MVVDVASCRVGAESYIASARTALEEVAVRSLRDEKLRRGLPFRYTCKAVRTDEVQASVTENPQVAQGVLDGWENLGRNNKPFLFHVFLLKP